MEHPTELSAESLWDEVSSRLRGALNETTFSTWFEKARGSALTDSDFTIAVPNDFTREWIEGHFLGLIKAGVRDVIGSETRVHLRVDSTAASVAQLAANGAAESDGEPVPVQLAPESTGMNPKYTFDLFVIGSSNRFAHAAALAVAEAPAQA